MNYRIENELISAEISDAGAELLSLKSKTSEIEYLWQADANIWNNSSPILFPIIGQLFQNKFTYNEKDYTLPKHGFAKNSTFTLSTYDQTNVVLSLFSDENTLLMYPFAFELRINFEVINNKLTVTHSVINQDKRTMFFSVGAHPGFNCAMGDVLEFEKEETLLTERIDANAILIDKKFPLLDNSKSIEITKDLFINDALFLTDYKSTSIKLRSPGHSRELHFDFGGAPFLGIWAKPAAPYVCIEPWYGTNDSYHPVKDISQKRGIKSLEANKCFSFAWSAEIFEPNC